MFVFVVIGQVVCYCVQLKMVLVVFYVCGYGYIWQLVYCGLFIVGIGQFGFGVFGCQCQGVVFVYCEVVVDVGYQQIVGVVGIGEVECVGQVVWVYEIGVIVVGIGIVKLVICVVQVECVVIVVVEEIIFQVEVQVVVCGWVLCFEVEVGLFGVDVEIGNIVMVVVYWY